MMNTYRSVIRNTLENLRCKTGLDQL